jgi:DNA-directed RNA polymerase subunit RPC12/RpoP
MEDTQDWCHCARCRPIVVARFDGTPCEQCGHRVLVNDVITTLNGTTWIHDDCLPDVAKPCTVEVPEQ